VRIGSAMDEPALLDGLRTRTPAMLDALRALVEAESPTADADACRACVEVADTLAAGLLGARGERVEIDGRVHLRWRFGERQRVLLVGHLDTVWPLGTLARWPFSVSGGRVSGPGVFDMKAGVVQLLFALAAIDAPDGVAVLLTTDEETGSPTGRALIAETRPGIQAALVLEPSAAGALKTERKGVDLYHLTVSGRAAHAGLDPASGANAALELAHQLVDVAALENGDTTVTPTMVTAGTAVNVVPAHATAEVDVRIATAAESERVAAGFAALTPKLAGTSIEVERVVSLAPLERRASRQLYARAEAAAHRLGLPPLAETSVGGGSDGNVLAGLGVPVLDGLGAVGDHAHAEGEHVLVDALAERAALVASLVAELVA
jgi:glutamate carboxypeptidase